jgi:hypothetical protein
MAKSKCTCGATILWKADEPQSDEWFLVARADVPDEIANLYPASTPSAFCSNCGRLWVAWTDDEQPSEYVPADPNVRPIRPKLK